MDDLNPDADLDREQLVADMVASLRTVLQLLLLTEGKNFEDQVLKLGDAVNSLLDAAGIAVCMRCNSHRPRVGNDEPRHLDPDTCDNAAEPWHQDGTTRAPTLTDDELTGWLRTALHLPPPLTPQERNDCVTRGLEWLRREANANGILKRLAETDK